MTGTTNSPFNAEFHQALMVTTLSQQQVIRSPAVEAALGHVPRHRFVPEAPLDVAYDAYEAVVIKTGPDGSALSSASAPAVVAAMLEQLQAQRGDRVLEVGAGTGYNAAVLAELVGPTGQVVTIEYDLEVAERARQALAAAGINNVTVLHGDGEFGHAAAAPYDRIIVTAGAWDVAGAWVEQLAPHGRLVVPLRLPWPMSVALERTPDGTLASLSTETCGFIPVEGAGHRASRTVTIGEDAIVIRVDDDRPIDSALPEALDHPAYEVWTGVEVGDGPSYDSLFLFLTTVESGFTKYTAAATAIEARRVYPLMGWGGPGVHDGATFAYLTNRRTRRLDGPRFELGVIAHGPAAAELADRLRGHLQTWNTTYRSATRPRITVLPEGAEGDHVAGQFLIDKLCTRWAITFSRP
ncbi:methyltransferase, FxLD system [Streptomyces sp. N35]|uniref:methyltransferase, FxLD system n=1 Tax=Streptomyces sp. N35 TaxID=2795730 RepID=UPI0018F7C24B|nr:methyltransferase, FxLD system [Streptomyces sp. N35]